MRNQVWLLGFPPGTPQDWRPCGVSKAWGGKRPVYVGPCANCSFFSQVRPLGLALVYPLGLATIWFFESLGWEAPGVSRAIRKVLVFPGTARWACPEVSFRIGDHVVSRSLGWETPGVSRTMRKVWFVRRYGPLGLS